MFNLLEGKEQHCEFDGVETVLKGWALLLCIGHSQGHTWRERRFTAGVQVATHFMMPNGSFANSIRCA